MTLSVAGNRARCWGRAGVGCAGAELVAPEVACAHTVPQCALRDSVRCGDDPVRRSLAGHCSAICMQMPFACRCHLHADAWCMQMPFACRCHLHADAICMQMPFACRCWGSARGAQGRLRTPRPQASRCLVQADAWCHLHADAWCHLHADAWCHLQADAICMQMRFACRCWGSARGARRARGRLRILPPVMWRREERSESRCDAAYGGCVQDSDARRTRMSESQSCWTRMRAGLGCPTRMRAGLGCPTQSRWTRMRAGFGCTLDSDAC